LLGQGRTASADGESTSTGGAAVFTGTGTGTYEVANGRFAGLGTSDGDGGDGGDVSTDPSAGFGDSADDLAGAAARGGGNRSTKGVSFGAGSVDDIGVRPGRHGWRKGKRPAPLHLTADGRRGDGMGGGVAPSRPFRPSFEPASDAFPRDAGKIAQIMAMGFGEGDAVASLKKNYNDVGMAINELLGM
jgi:hypothetical protein